MYGAASHRSGNAVSHHGLDRHFGFEALKLPDLLNDRRLGSLARDLQ